MAQPIWRWSEKIIGLTVTTSLATCQIIPLNNAAGGALFIPGGSNLTAIAIYGAPMNTVDEPNQAAYTYLPLNDLQCLSGTWTPTAAAFSVTAGEHYALPDCCFGCRGLKILGTFSSGSTGTIDLSLKG